MNMNLLIVDDEQETLMWLEEMFRCDFEYTTDVYAACSAFQALELLNKIKFDVVLTDIKMPGMDGITLFQKIKRNWPRCKVVFLTGYGKFDDMYQIFNNKDVRYLLKNEDDEVIIKTVRDSFDELQSEIEQEALQEKYRQDMERMKLWEGREFMGSLLKGELSALGKDELSEHAQKAGISVELNRKILLFLVRIDKESDQTEQPAKIYALLERANQIIRKNLPADINLYMDIVEGHWGMGLVQPKEQENDDMARVFTVVRGGIEYSQTFFERLGGRSFSVVIESTAIDCHEITGMFFRMKQIMVGGLGKEKDVIAHVEALSVRREQAEPGKTMMKIPALRAHLELCRREDFFEVLGEVGEEMLKSRSRHDFRGMQIYYSVSVLLLQFINENQLNERIAFHIGLYKLTKIDEHASWEDSLHYLYEVSDAVFRLLGNDERNLTDKALKRICDYIEEHLAQDLSLTKLAEIGGFNASYLSRLFKQVYEVTITEYIYQKRMALAAALLGTSNCKIQEVAEKTGYQYAYSFGRAFKNFYGMSPAEYREVRRKDSFSE
jgi:two-component system response regulator YesN|nr:response regulator [uncultured Acetatifactor sp.]